MSARIESGKHIDGVKGRRHGNIVQGDLATCSDWSGKYLDLFAILDWFICECPFFPGTVID